MGATARDPALDAVRGWCIVSMATAHLALGSTWWSVMHWAGWIDGAVGFVLLSGLVVGMTQRRAVRRGGLTAAYRKTSRRSALLLVIHIELCFVALTVSAADPRQSGRLPSAPAEGGWVEAVWKVLTLRINPPTSSILSLYVVMSFVGMLAVFFLRSGRPVLAVAVSGVIYCAAWLFPGETTFPERAFVPGYVNWATWQGLFVLAMVVGWYWDAPQVRRVVSSRGSLVVAAALSGGLAVFGHADVQRRVFVGSAVEDPLRWLFGNGKLGPGTMVFAFAACLTLYRAIRWATILAPVESFLRPLVILGRRSLDSYVIIAAFSLCAPAVASYRPDEASGAILALGVLLLCLTWSLFRGALARMAPTGAPQTQSTASGAAQLRR